MQEQHLLPLFSQCLTVATHNTAFEGEVNAIELALQNLLYYTKKFTKDDSKASSNFQLSREQFIIKIHHQHIRIEWES